MLVGVDEKLCTGAGTCALIAPDVFDQADDTGLVILRSPEPPPESWESVREAAVACPRGAILLTENG